MSVGITVLLGFMKLQCDSEEGFYLCRVLKGQGQRCQQTTSRVSLCSSRAQKLTTALCDVTKGSVETFRAAIYRLKQLICVNSFLTDFPAGAALVVGLIIRLLGH